jgi:hypothetical protein
MVLTFEILVDVVAMRRLFYSMLSQRDCSTAAIMALLLYSRGYPAFPIKVM